jgi:cytosine/uracil/thiamine/allantoin permease
MTMRQNFVLFALVSIVVISALSALYQQVIWAFVVFGPI